MKRKSILIGLASYVMWGVLPLYWNLLHGVDSVIILCNRVLWSAVFSVLVLAFQKRLPVIKETFCNRRSMRCLVPAALLITANWGIYIWAVTNGHTLDTSLGYYINPLMAFALGLIVFKERCSVLEYVAIGVAALGVIISTISYGAFPYISLLLAVTFGSYGMVKKMVHIDAIVSIAIETILIAPFVLVYMICSPAGQAAWSALTPAQALLFIGSGPMTALPLMLFSYGVNGLPLSTMGFLQYASPTLIAIMGIFVLGETFTPAQIVAFVFILIALVIYSVGLVRRERAAARMEAK